MPGPDAPQALPEPVGSVVARCLDPDPGRRPTAEALSAMLDEPATLAMAPESATATLAATRVAPRHVAPVRGRRNGRLAAALLVVLVVAAIVILAATSGGGSTPPSGATHHHARQRTATAIPQAATPAAQARVLARWLRQHAG
jgi:hypothetical protein